QSLEAYRQYLRWIADCDREIERQLSRIESKIDPAQHPLVRTKEERRKPRGNEARFDLPGFECTQKGFPLGRHCRCASLWAAVLHRPEQKTWRLPPAINSFAHHSSRVSKLQFRICFKASIRSATSAGVPFRPRVALLGRRRRSASYTG